MDSKKEIALFEKVYKLITDNPTIITNVIGDYIDENFTNVKDMCLEDENMFEVK